MTRLLRATLTDFRNYARLVFEPGPGLNVVAGPNGSGKTNLLEAISLLAPGRGLRQARADRLVRHGAAGWAVAARVLIEGETRQLGTGSGPETGFRREVRRDGAKLRGREAAEALLPAVWLTPQMERLFGEAAAGRRRFVDRLLAALEPGHAGEMAAHDTAVQNRNRMLAERVRDPSWLAAVEDSIARHAVAIAASRALFCRRLNEAAADAAVAAFPAARLALRDPVAERLAAAPARTVEAWLREELAARRAADAAAGATTVGAHRADLAIAEAASGLDAAEASTGEQKALLVGVVLAQARLMAAARGVRPVLLLDEPLVHLDEHRRAALFALLRASGAQALLTGTDAAAFAPIAGKAAFFRAADGSVAPA